jgi:AbrB family looped-hinge helix DNA binding protein
MVLKNGKMPFMSTITEIDKAGRLVVPKKMRDALHLRPGTRLILDQKGESIIIRSESKPRGLYMKKGTWVYDTGAPFPGNVQDWIDKDRDDRIRSILGEAGEP